MDLLSMDLHKENDCICMVKMNDIFNLPLEMYKRIQFSEPEISKIDHEQFMTKHY